MVGVDGLIHATFFTRNQKQEKEVGIQNENGAYIQMYIHVYTYVVVSSKN